MFSASLKIGQVLTIPTKVGATHNTASTYAPYDASKVVGSTTPNLPTPAGLPQSSGGGGGCGGLGSIIMVVVAVVATVVTAGAAFAAIAPEIAGAGSFLSLGVSVLTGGEVGLAGVAAAAIGGAVGSIASQVVGNAIGAEDGFSWSQVALSAIGSAASAGVGEATGATEEAAADISPTLGESVGRAALSNVFAQGVDITVGLQKSFSWQSVAGAAVGAGVSSGASSELQSSGALNDFGSAGQYINQGVSNFAGSVSQSLVSGGRVTSVQVEADAFGNALGQSLANYMQTPSPVPSQYSLASGMGDGQGFTSSGGQGFTSGGQGLPWGQNLANDTPQFTMGQSASSYSLSSGNETGQGLSLNGGLSLNYQGLSVPGSLGDSGPLAANDETLDNWSNQAMGAGENPTAPTTIIAGKGQGISSLIGSSNPASIGNFMQVNGLTSDQIQYGRQYVLPDDANPPVSG